jgi:hypothetical protein
VRRAKHGLKAKETAELNDKAPVPEERWYSGLVRLFGGKSASQKTADITAANPNALLAFPSEDHLATRALLHRRRRETHGTESGDACDTRHEARPNWCASR